MRPNPHLMLLSLAAMAFAAPSPSDPEPPPSVGAATPGARAPQGTLRIFLIGDSTVASYKAEQFPLMGWGQVLDRLFDDKVQVLNHAVGGRSTKSFIDEKRWEKVQAALTNGDWLFIQFGHNDAKKDKPELYAAPDGAYRDHLARFIEEARAKGAFPVLVTSVARRTFGADGKLWNSHGEYPDAMKAVAEKTRTPLIDLCAKSGALLASLGAEDSKKLYNWCDAGQYPGWPKGNKDDSHFNEKGALEMARLVAGGLTELNLPISSRLRK